MTRILVAAWAGSPNLGDELLLAATLALLRDKSLEPIVISVNPEKTQRDFDVETVHHLSPTGLRKAFDRAHGMVFGGGGLLQDETSAWNLPYHLSRVRMADRRGLRWVGIGLGSAGLTTHRGRQQVRDALVNHRSVVVRDRSSLEALSELGIPRVELGADLAWALARPTEAPEDALIVSLRLPQGHRLLPGAVARPGRRDDAWVSALASSLDVIAAETGWLIRFVAFERGSDDVLHRQVANCLTAPTELLTPSRGELLAIMASGRACISMRYHGIVTAAMAGVPGIALTFSPKLGSIAAELGLPSLGLEAATLSKLPALVRSLDPGPIAAAVEQLTRRAARSSTAIDLLLP